MEDVSSCTDEQTKKLTTVLFGAVFDIKCSWPAAYRAHVHAQARCGMHKLNGRGWRATFLLGRLIVW